MFESFISYKKLLRAENMLPGVANSPACDNLVIMLLVTKLAADRDLITSAPHDRSAEAIAR